MVFPVTEKVVAVTRFFDHPFWERGFRPFFFAGGAYAVASILLWVLSYNGQITPPAFLQDPMSWHAHEMIFGFAVAIVSGFLLTAVANWTGWSPVRKAHLASLLAVWVAGRVSMNLEAVPFWLGVVIEGIYLPFLAISLAVPLLGTKNVRNFIFLGMLGALFVCDMAFLFSESRTPLYVALGLIAMMISLIGGRVIPSFTVATLRRRGILIFQKDQTKLDVAAVLSLITVLVSIAALGTDSVVTAGASFIAAATHLARMRNYYPVMALKDPMLWILHVGYGWLVLGLVMVGFAGLGMIGFSTALHALTAGSIGSMTLGMMCRVTLGHTGRDITAGKATVFAFFLMQVAAVSRVFAPLVFPDTYAFWIFASGTLWAACFGIYLSVYGRMLFTDRP